MTTHRKGGGSALCLSDFRRKNDHRACFGPVGIAGNPTRLRSLGGCRAGSLGLCRSSGARVVHPNNSIRAGFGTGRRVAGGNWDSGLTRMCSKVHLQEPRIERQWKGFEHQSLGETPVGMCENNQVSGCASFVTMVKPTDLWNLDDDAFVG